MERKTKTRLRGLGLPMLMAGLLLGGCGWGDSKVQLPQERGDAMNAPLPDMELTRIDGSVQSLNSYRGKALLIVNTASKCGFTGQYAGLEALNRRYAERGLVVMGFPCNEFMGQEPGSNEEILEFCQASFDVDFPLFAKLAVKPGPDQAPLYRTLTQEGPEAFRGPIKWNFTKFLVDPQGRLVGRFEPAVEPEAPELVAAIEAVLPPAAN